MSAPASETPPPGERRGPDRRITHPLLADWTWAWRGRRRTHRRDEDRMGVQLDIHGPGMLATILVIILLSAADALFTLWLINAGLGVEVNPLMRALLERDVQLFVNVKIAMTGGALIFLVACSHLVVFRTVQVRRLLTATVAIYVTLIGYHLTLLNKGGLLFL